MKKEKGPQEILAQVACSVPEAAQVLGIGRSHAYELIAAKELRSIRTGRRTLVPTAALHEWVANKSVAV